MAKIMHFSCLDSTHKQAVRMVEQSCCMDGDVIIADIQTAGVGRYNRTWESVKGNIFLSMMKNKSNYDLGQLSLTVACAVHNLLEQFVVDKALLQLHWPNDVFYNSKKLCGVLISVINNWIIISVGINIVPVEALDRAISLREIANDPIINTSDMITMLIDKIYVWMQFLSEKGFDKVRDYWLLHAFGLASDIEINNGMQIVKGVFHSIDENGLALVKTLNGIVSVTSGDFIIK